MSYGISFMMLGKKDTASHFLVSTDAHSHTAQLAGIGLGLSISGAIYVNQALENLSALLPDVSRDTLQLAITGTSSAYFQSLDPTLRGQAVDIIVAAMDHSFIPVYAGGAFSLVASLLFTVRRLSIPSYSSNYV